MKGRVYLAISPFVALAGLLLSLNANAKNADPQVAVSWRLVGNRPDSRFAAQLNLRNDSAESLPADWALYFNACSKLLPDSLPGEFKLTHVNGDLYVLRPNERSKPINPGASVQIHYEGSPWAINVSDAPSGFYLVLNEQSAQPSKPVSVPMAVEPFPTATNLQRGAADLVPVVTDEARYIENEKLTKLSADQLVKVVPTPLEIASQTGHVRLRSSSRIVSDAALTNEARFLADALNELLADNIDVRIGIPTASSTLDEIRLRIDAAKLAQALQRQSVGEAYILSVSPEKGVEIIGGDATGVFYGIQTLRNSPD